VTCRIAARTVVATVISEGTLDLDAKRTQLSINYSRLSVFRSSWDDALFCLFLNNFNSVSTTRKPLNWFAGFFLQFRHRNLTLFLAETQIQTDNGQPDYLHNLISVQSSGRTRSSSVVTLAFCVKKSDRQRRLCSAYRCGCQCAVWAGHVVDVVFWRIERRWAVI